MRKSFEKKLTRSFLARLMQKSPRFVKNYKSVDYVPQKLAIFKVKLKNFWLKSLNVFEFSVCWKILSFLWLFQWIAQNDEILQSASNSSRQTSSAPPLAKGKISTWRPCDIKLLFSLKFSRQFFFLCKVKQTYCVYVCKL